MNDTQLIERPNCQQCGNEPGYVSCMGKLMCLTCLERVKQKLQRQQNIWLSEDL